MSRYSFTFRGLSQVIFTNGLKFCIGYMVGAFLWWVLIHPYRKFFSYQFDSYLPQFALCMLISFIFMISTRARTVMVLFIPTMIGGASQNYIQVALFVTLFAHPITNIATNAAESIRVIGCSLMMAFEHLKDRARLVLSPIVELVQNSKNEDLNPMKTELFNLQNLVLDLRREAEFNVGQLIKEKNSVNNESIVVAPKVPQLKEIEKDLEKRINTTSKKTREMASKAQDLIRATSFSFDRENLGLKASIDTNQLSKLMAESKLELEKSANFNLTEIMFANCIFMIRQAKQSCEIAIEGIRQSCVDTIGSFLATIWCSPIAMTISTFCPWIMNQIVDEKSSCDKMRESVNKIRTDPFGITGNQSVEQVYRNLTQQIVSFSDISDDQTKRSTSTANLNGSGIKQPQQQQHIPNRLELNISFNRQTRELFTRFDNLIKFLSDKYKLRHALLVILLFFYEIYTTITFLIIIKQANAYLSNYLTKIRFDNHYITGLFNNLDKLKRYRGEPSVLPLTREESKRYISTLTCKRRTQEEQKTLRASCMMILLFVAFTASLLYLDNIFCSILISIRDHALIKFHELGHHEFRVNITGKGSVARIVDRLTSRLNSVYDLNRYSDTRKCLPNPAQTGSGFYLQFAYLITLYIFIDQATIYAMRLRRVTAAYFYPSKEIQRIDYLFKLILLDRKSNNQFDSNTKPHSA